MKKSILLFLSLWLFSPLIWSAAPDPTVSAVLPPSSKSSSTSASQPDLTRLTQEYMARRAEWVGLRAVAMAKIKKAQTEGEKNSIRQKLEADERTLRAASADLARRLREAEQAQRTVIAHPPAP